MKGCRTITILVVLAMLFTGCGKTPENTQPSEVVKPGNEEIIRNAEHVMPSDFEQLENEMLDLDTYTLENDPAEYSQASYPWNLISKGDAGYYFNESSTLRLFDTESKEVVTVCDKPNCKHESGDTCVASVRFRTSGVSLDLGFQSFYKGYVYCTGHNHSTQYVSLYRIAGDGSGREEVMPLFRFDIAAESYSDPYFVIAQDTVFFVDKDEEQPCIRKCKLGDDKSSIIFATGCSEALLMDMKVYGDFLFFLAGAPAGEIYEGGTYAYNMRSGELKLVHKGICAFSVLQSKLLYSDKDGIASYDLRTEEINRIIEDDKNTDFVNNSKYIVRSNMEVYSLSGEYICKLALEEFRDIYGMDEEYIIARGPIPTRDDEVYIPMILVKPTSELDDKPFIEYRVVD